MCFNFHVSCKRVFNNEQRIQGLRLSNVFINKTENYTSVFFYFSSWTIIKLPFNFDFFRTYFSDWSNNVQIIRYFINKATQNCVIELSHLYNCLNMNIFISFKQVFKQISLHYSIYFDSFNWKLRNYVVCILYFI